ncbi:phasin family protein [Marinococcus luteus]|uniref:phasin family protein n=1 Tax=Marinococcus luteus TaxID=1122204 RepID=UPI002ACC8614|nr:hypothetical protein [Marinococcus luteus]MDZ5782271.1 hypothetical protein [Marinococcus luteus]
MNDMLKKGFFLGLGAASYGREKVQTYLDDLVTKGKITPREADEWKEEMIQRGSAQSDSWNSQAKNSFENRAESMGIATKRDIDRLEQKLDAIEKAMKRPDDE